MAALFKERWSNWSGGVTAAPQAIWRPRDEEELAALVRGSTGLIRPAGSGHSFTPLCASSGALVSLENMSGLIAAYPETQEAELWAGTPVYAVGPLLHPHGLALANQGDIDRQTLGGAIGTGTHGTGTQLGSLSSMVTGVTLVTGQGDILNLNRNSDPELFEAAQLSLGSLGIITRFRLKLVPSFALNELSYVAPAEQVIANLREMGAAHRHFEFFWFPYADQLVVKILDVAAAIPERVLDIPAMKERGERVSRDDKLFRLICETVRRIPPSSGYFHRMLTRQMAAGEAKPGRVRWSFETFPHPRTTRFNEMEYAVPKAVAGEAIKAVVERVRKDKIATAFPFEFRFVQGDDVWLSPFEGGDRATISVHQYHKMDQTRLFAACEAVFREFGGRPHWGKQHSLGVPDLAVLYPHWDNFHAARRRADPENRMLSPYLSELFETGIAGKPRPR